MPDIRLDLTTFFAYARRAPFGGRLSSEQVDGINALLDAFGVRVGLDGDHRWLANILAQVFHETGGRMVAIKETMGPKEASIPSDAEVIRRLDREWAAGHLSWVKTPYWRKDKDGKAWFGRGPIQVTHKPNYDKIGRILGADLVGNPDLLLDRKLGAASAVVGMANGVYTGKKLADYFSAVTDDPVGARRIVNGSDKAKLIAGYHKAFLDALAAAAEALHEEVLPPDVSPDAAKPDDVRPAESKSLWSMLVTFLTGGGLAAFSAIDNPYALGAVALMIVAGAIGAWLVLTGRVEIKRILS